MIIKKLAAAVSAVALVTVLGVASVGSALAQTTTPPATATPDTTTTESRGLGPGFGFRGGSSAQFDLVAEQLGMTPTELFEALHSGQTLSDIAAAKGVDLATIETALNANRITEMKAQLAQAVQDGTMTQEEADWWTTGIDNGWVNGGKGGFGIGGGRHGRGGFGLRSAPDANQTTPATPTPSTGTTS